MFDYQERHRYFAQTPGGVEELAAQELSELGAAGIRTAHRGLHFEAQRETLYRINYHARLLTRVLAPLKTFHCHNTQYLYRQVKLMDWSGMITPDHTFSVSSTVSHSAIKHSRYAALCVKDGIADHFRGRFSSRPSVRRADPDLRVNLHIENNLATLSLDTSGESLHRRGYRGKSLEAPMQETLAAAVIRIVAWDGTRRLWDPFCGSGTLLAEALMEHCRIPSGFLRDRFGLQGMPDFDKTLWLRVQEEGGKSIRALPANLLVGSDASPAAVESASENLGRLPFGDKVALSSEDFRNSPGLEGSVIVGNPPHGVRLLNRTHIASLYKDLGDFLKQRCKGSSVFLYLGNRDLVPLIGLKPSWKMALPCGGLDGRLVKFEIY